jgi:hypothetical protein
MYSQVVMRAGECAKKHVLGEVRGGGWVGTLAGKLQVINI